MKITKNRLYEIVFEADTPAGKTFDVAILIIISLSILVVMLDSVEAFYHKYRFWLFVIEWIITIAFTFEYFLRIFIVKKPISYIFSFYGIVDLLSIIPTYLSLVVAGTHGLVVIRALRLLRLFRIFKLSRHVSAGSVILDALKASRNKIFVFMYFVLMVVIIIGTLFYLIEGKEHGFDSIPKSIYWAIVTLTTVGYGDIAPQTALGQTIASFVMVLGYAVIAVPTGIVTVELSKNSNKKISTQVCPNCLSEGHDTDAIYCKYCGTELNEQENISCINH